MEQGKKTYYYDVESTSGCVGVFLKDADVCPAGTTVFSMPVRHRNVVYKRIGVEYDIFFLFEDMSVEIDFYAVPQVNVFAVDCSGGLLGTVGEVSDFDSKAQICYIDRERRVWLAAENARELMEKKDGWKRSLQPFDGVRLFANRKEAMSCNQFIEPDSNGDFQKTTNKLKTEERK